MKKIVLLTALSVIIMGAEEFKTKEQKGQIKVPKKEFHKDKKKTYPRGTISTH